MYLGFHAEGAWSSSPSQDDEWFLCTLTLNDPTPSQSVAVQSPQIQQAIHGFMTEFSDVLADDLPVDYNVSRAFEATIDINPAAKPISLRPYLLPLFLEKELQRTLEYLVARNIIEPSDSPFSFPVLLP
eukprot:751884-Hanusia_phi.AAC.2